MNFIKSTVTLTLAGSITVWVWTMANKLTSEQMGMLMMALVVIVPLCVVLILMVMKADADRRLDHIERVEREKTERKRQREFQPPVVVVQNRIRLPRPHVDNNVTVQNAMLQDGTCAYLIDDNGRQIGSSQKLLGGSK